MKISIQAPLLSLSILFCAIFLHVPGVQAQFIQDIKVVSQNREGRAEFGTALAITDEYAAVSASRENIAAGAVYIYRLNADNEWEYAQTLRAADAKSMAEYGSALEFGDGFLVVASGRSDIDSTIRAGSLYTYTLNRTEKQWEFVTKLVASDYGNEDHMGAYPFTLCVYKNTIAVGTPGKNAHTGAVYVFQRQNNKWTEVQKITSPNPRVNAQFGESVCMNDNYIIIGASGENDNTGKAYIYNKDSGNSRWEFYETISPSDGQANMFFGTSVGIYQTEIIVGAYAEGHGDNNISAAYIFKPDSAMHWEQVQKLTGKTSAEDNYYGWMCAIAKDKLLVTAPHAYGLEEGNVFLYSRGEDEKWEKKQSLETSSNREKIFYGWDVDMSGDYIIVGAPRADLDKNGENPISDAGAAFIFKKETTSTVKINPSKNHISLYPNPVRNYLTYNTERLVREVSIYTITGICLLTTEQQRIRLGGFQEGIYVIVFTFKDGSKASKKFIME